ncbi:MAG TPA: aminotransferase class V-fold PLP-dependent enzyme [Anaeromyxobacteraceae bacterium]|nr:aminotransferase class V-fold PLP-dependent enzyme [Anaeromyxobacteraceae bacterium]
MPTPSTAALLADAARRAAAYLDGLERRAVSPSPQAVSALAELDRPLPEEGAEPSAMLDELDRRISPATMAMAGPRFFGFVIGGALPGTLAANVLASAWDQNSAKWAVTPGTAAIEKVALRWTLEALGLPAETSGGFVTGATVANFTALAAARHAVLARAGWDVEARGLFGAPPVTVVIGAEAHVSVLKALAMLGLGRERAVTVPVDGQGRIRPDALPRLRGPAIVCTQAGNVNTGAFDPAAAVVARAREAGAWVHVDGAFGLWAAAAPRRAHLVAGVAEADSWATDAHKWLNVPYDSGIALVRDGEALRAAMGISAAYLPEPGVRDPADHTPELSRRARGVEVWAALRILGRRGLADLVERTCRHAARFAQGLGAAGHRILNEVVLNQVLVSFGDDGRTRRAIDALQADGTCWCGGTVWQGRTAMRISVSSWATTDEDVERSLEAMLRAARA